MKEGDGIGVMNELVKMADEMMLLTPTATAIDSSEANASKKDRKIFRAVAKPKFCYSPYYIQTLSSISVLSSYPCPKEL